MILRMKNKYTRLLVCISFLVMTMPLTMHSQETNNYTTADVGKTIGGIEITRDLLNGDADPGKPLPAIGMKDVGDIIDQIDAPNNCSEITYDGTYLWMVSEQAGLLYQIDPSDGSVVKELQLPGYNDYDPNSYGIAYDGNYLWHSDYRKDRIYKINPANGNVLYSFAFANILGLTWDGSALWGSNPMNDIIYQINVTTGQEVNSFVAPTNHCIGLTWDNGNLWASDNSSGTIYKIDPVSTTAISSFDGPEYNHQGLAFDGSYLWIAANNTNTLYQVDVASSAPDIEVTPSSLTMYEIDAKMKASRQMDTKEGMGEANKDKKYAFGLKIPEEVKSHWKTHEPKVPQYKDLKGSIDWSMNDSPVKNQGPCGSCWAFSTVGLIENLSGMSDLSEQVLVSCIPDNDCGGGWHGYALEYIHNDSLPEEECYEYLATNGNCVDKCTDPMYRVTVGQYDKYGHWGVPTASTVDDLKALLQSGPVLVAMLVPEGSSFYDYNSGIYNYSGGTIPSNRGHSVLVVGYDDASSYFKVKNSWGTSWGENGYFRIAYDDVTDDVKFGGYACTAADPYVEGASNIFTVKNLGSQELNISSITMDKAWLSLSESAPLKVDPYDSKAISCTVNWGAVPAPQDVCTITFNSDDPDEAAYAVQLTAVRQGEALPPPTNFSATLIDSDEGVAELTWNHGPDDGFYENFEDGVADNWVPVTGSWSVSGNTYNAVSQDYTIASSFYNNYYEDYEYEVRMRKTVGEAANLSLYFNGDPSDLGSNGEWKNTYALLITTLGQWKLVKVENGSWTNISASWPNSSNLNQGLGAWNTVKVVYSSGYIDIYFNGVKEDSFYDATYTSGKVGIKMYDSNKEGEAEFDYAEVSPITKSYTFGEVAQNEFRNRYAATSNLNTPEGIPAEITGTEKAPEPAFGSTYTYAPKEEKASFQYYLIYRNGAMIATAANKSYLDTLPSYDAYNYRVSAYYTEGESEKAGPESVAWLAPNIHVAPDAYRERLEAGSTDGDYLTITNTGNSMLNYNISIKGAPVETKQTKRVEPGDFITSDGETPRGVDATTGAPFKTITMPELKPLRNGSKGGNILWDMTHGSFAGYHPYGRYSALTSLLMFSGCDVYTTDAGVDNLDLSQYDVLVVNLLSNWYSAYTTAEVDAIKAFVAQGGNLLLMGDNTSCPNANINPVAQEWNIELGVSYISPNDLYIDDFSALEIFDGIDSIYYRAAGEVGVDSPAEIEAFTDGELGAVATNLDDAGKVIALGDANTWTNWHIGIIDNQFFAENVLNWLMPDADLDFWLTCDQYQGNIFVNESEVIEVTYDATDLIPDVYEAEILIQSNDPDEPLVITPVTLHVTDGLSLYPPQHFGATITDHAAGEVTLNWRHMIDMGFYEDFEDNQAQNFMISDGRIAATNGELHMEGDENSTWASAYYDKTYSDFTFEFEFTRLQSATTINYTIGAFIRAAGHMSFSNPRYGYLIALSANGSYSVWRENGTNETALISWTYCDFINTGLNTNNVVTIDAYGPNFDIYINGFYVNSFTDTTFPSGYAGVASYDASGTNNEVTWDYVELITDADPLALKRPAKEDRNGKVVDGTAAYTKGPLMEHPDVEAKGFTRDMENKGHDFQNFNVYRNATAIGTTTETYYKDTLTTLGTYEYEISAQYAEGESQKAGPREITWGETPPRMEVNPVSLYESLLVGDTSLQNLQLMNVGSSTLNYHLFIDDLYATLKEDEKPAITTEPYEGGLQKVENSENGQQYLPGFAKKEYTFASKDELENILLYEETPDGIYHYDEALQNMGLSHTFVASMADLYTELTGGTNWDLVIVNSYANFITTDILDELHNLIEAGGFLIFTAWDVYTFTDHDLLQTLGVNYVDGFSHPINFSAVDACHTIFNYPNDVKQLNWTDDQWATDGQFVEAIGNSSGLAAFEGFPETRSVVLGENENCFFNAFQAANFNGDHDADGKLDVVELIENQIHYLMHGAVSWLTLEPMSGMIPPGGTVNTDVHFDATGLAPDEYNPTIQVVSNDPVNTAQPVPVTLNVVSEGMLIPPYNLDAGLTDIDWGEVRLSWDYTPIDGFYEDFEDGEANHWTPVTGTWNVTDGKFHAASGGMKISSCYYNTDYSNMEYEVKVRKTVGNKYNAGIYFNGDPGELLPNGCWANTYELHYSTDGNWAMFKYVDGADTPVQPWTYSDDLNQGLGAWNVLKVVYADGYIDVYFNGILQGSYFEDTYPSGKIGLKMYDNAKAGEVEYEYVSLTPLSDKYVFGKVDQPERRPVYQAESAYAQMAGPEPAIDGYEETPEPLFGPVYTYQAKADPAFTHFNVFRDDSVIGNTTDTVYIDTLPAGGNYDYEVSAQYAEGESEREGIVNLNWVKPEYTVTFHVTDEDGNVLENASIAIDGDNMNTDASGEASIDLENGEYAYTVAKSGYNTVTDMVSVWGAPVNEEVILPEKTYTVTFVASSAKELLEDVHIGINGNDLYTDASGEATIELVNGEYEYTASKTGYHAKTDTVKVEDGPVTEQLTLDPVTYTVTFSANDGVNPLENATIHVNSTDLTTAANGTATIDLPDGEYEYTASKSGYSSVTDTVTVSGSNVMEYVTLSVAEFTVTFNVSDGVNPLENATVTINSTDLTTNASGVATIGLTNGDYPYTVSATGFQDTSNTVVVADADVVLTIVMKSATGLEELEAGEIRIYPNPSRGQVTIACKAMESIQLITLQGRVIREQSVFAKETELQVEGIKAGVYLLRLQTRDGAMHYKRLMISD